MRNNLVGLVVVPQRTVMAIQEHMPDYNFFPHDRSKPPGAKLTTINMTFRSEPKLRKADNTYYYVIR